MILAVASHMLCVLLNWIRDSQSVPFVFNANKIWQTRFEVDYISSHVMGRWIWMGSKITTRARVISLVTHKCIIEHVASLSDFQIWAWGRKKVVKLRFMMSIISWTCLSKYWTWWFGESYWFEREKKLNIHFRICWPTDATLHYVNLKRLPLCPILTYKLTQETLQPKCDNKNEWNDILMSKRWEWRWSLLP